ncbi:hypothetical protein BBR47_50200 [Brevibacillus brevis NBRC 100599]|uniref:Uncharacterized protein n=1 Tax=Brevibacillus brevis (strain 47 / JCM 6285 / NBRC 100599) TaxID=358681 RepID=C0Z591_BREBN|nr:hypothetical protein BBR47_50200 [Brevibacillus brevis NBRC 100599]
MEYLIETSTFEALPLFIPERTVFTPCGAEAEA